MRSRTFSTKTDAQSATILAGVGESAQTIASGLQLVFGDGDTQSATALRGAGENVDDVATALQLVYGDSSSSTVIALHASGFSPSDIALAMKNALNDSISSVLPILQDLDTPTVQIAQSLYTAGYDAGSIANAFVNSDVVDEFQIPSFLRQSLQLNNSALTAAMEKLGALQGEGLTWVFNPDGSATEAESMESDGAIVQLLEFYDSKLRLNQFDASSGGAQVGSETRAYVDQPDGSYSVTVTDYDGDGVLVDSEALTYDNLSRETSDQFFADDGTLTQSDTDVYNNDGSRTETTNDFQSNLDYATTFNAADQRTSSTDFDGSGHISALETWIYDLSGATTDHTQFFNPAGIETGERIGILNSDGSQSQTLSFYYSDGDIQSTSTDYYAAGVFSPFKSTFHSFADGGPETQSSTTFYNPDGSVVSRMTVADYYYADGSLNQTTTLFFQGNSQTPQTSTGDTFCR